MHISGPGTHGFGAQSSQDDEIDLAELWLALRRRSKLVGVVAASVVAMSGVITAYQRLYRPVYEGSFALLITDPISSDNGRKTPGSTLGGSLFEQLALNTTNNDIPTLIELLQSPLLLRPIAQRFELNENQLARRINITTGGVKRKEAEGVLKVSLIGRNPEEDQRLLEAISEAYLDTALNQRQQRLVDGISFLNQQAPSLQAKTDKIQTELADFRRRHSLIEPSVEGEALKKREAEIVSQILGLEAERSRLELVRQEIANGNLSARGFQEAISTGNGSDRGSQSQGLAVSDADQSLLQQLIQVETELAEARSKFQPTSSMVQSLQARLNQLQPLLRSNQLEAVDAALALNAGRLATARNQEATLNQQFLKKPALIKQYEALQNRLALAQDNLSGLVSARETFQLESAQQSVPWRVINPPNINPNPIQPSVPRNMALGLMFGALAGAGAGLVRDRLDHVFHNSEEVKNDLRLPLLGHIPHVEFFKGVREDKRFLLKELDDSNLNKSSASDNEQSARYERFFYQEAFRNLFTSIRFLNSEQPLQAVALTSSLPEEGKSLVNVLLAKTLSEMGQRVLLIDADLRKPQMHTRLGLNNLSGLSNLLTDDGQHWRDVLQNVPGYNDWSVITAGRRPPDPTRLLSSKRMHNLVHDLSQSKDFDLVLFDTPPVLGLADAALVAEHCDGLMLLVSLDRVDRSLPKEAVHRINSSGAPLLGLITNSVKTESSKRSKGYGYGGYGYGYSGYGYATYAHYADEDNQNNTVSKPEEPQNQPHKNWVAQVKLRTNQLMRWIDS